MFRGFGRSKVALVTQESSAEARGPGRTARKASRRPGRTLTGRPARVIAHFGATLQTAPGACSVVFGRSKMLQGTQESNAEALGPGRTARKASRRPGRTATGRPARVTAHFGALLGDTPDSSGSMFCGIWASKRSAGDAGKQCGGPGTRKDSQKAVQSGTEARFRGPSCAIRSFEFGSSRSRGTSTRNI